MKAPRWIVLLAVAVMAAILIAIASAASDRSSKSEAAHAGPYKIALANSFIGNTWRVEMANLFKGGCKMPPYNKQVTCSVYNSGNDVSKQTQQNGIIKQACDRGIVVVSFDNTVTAPCAQTVNTNQLKFGSQMAQYLVDSLNGKGNVIMVTGVAGTFADGERNKGAEAVFKANPGIKVVAKYSGSSASLAAAGRRRLGPGRYRRCA